MLRNAFEMFKGIGPGAVQKLEAGGVRCWRDALVDCEGLPVGPKARKTLALELPRAIERFEAGDTLFFDDILKPKDAWRLFSSFPERCVCFDVETTGLSPDTDDITVISSYRPATRELRVFIRHENLDEFPSSLREGDVLVGFHSRGFDTPFIKKHFGSRLPRFAQIDTRWVLHAMGIKGGLKAIEADHFGISRPEDLVGFDGMEAVLAWEQWMEHRDRSARDTLVRYCCADSYVLDYIVRTACRELGCVRFSAPIPASVLFRSGDPASWPSELPEIPSPVADLSRAPCSKPRPAPQAEKPLRAAKRARSEESPVEAEAVDDVVAEEVTYQHIVAMALADGMVTDDEAHLLDLFATTNGLSRAQRLGAENEARALYTLRGIRGVAERIIARGHAQAQHDLDQLLLFALVDGSVDPREATLLIDLAQRLQLSQVELDRRAEDARARADELLGWVK